MNHPLLHITRTCNGDIQPHRIVTLDPADTTGKTVVQASDVDVPLYGVADSLGGADGGRADIQTHGHVVVEYGDTVAINDPLTSDADGKAIPAPGSIATVHIVGWANSSGTAGELGHVRLAPARLAQ